jgi:hypothetical protein
MRPAPMPRYYFHVCDGDGFTEDEEGRELPDLEAARGEAIKGARSIMEAEVRAGTVDLASFIEVENDSRELVFTLPFSEAIRIKS